MGNRTKQNILETALTLFNEQGVSNVSLRVIADQLNISIGNLQYHFKKRETILEALYYELVEKIDEIYSVQPDDLLHSMLNVSKDMIAILYDYRFFLLDFVTITRNNQKIKQHYATLSKQRESEFLQAVHMLIEHGILREERLQDEYRNLYKRMEVISNFWFSSILIQEDSLSDKSITAYSELMSHGIFPYLTEKAKDRYLELFPGQLL